MVRAAREALRMVGVASVANEVRDVALVVAEGVVKLAECPCGHRRSEGVAREVAREDGAEAGRPPSVNRGLRSARPVFGFCRAHLARSIRDGPYSPEPRAYLSGDHCWSQQRPHGVMRGCQRAHARHLLRYLVTWRCMVARSGWSAAARVRNLSFDAALTSSQLPTVGTRGKLAATCAADPRGSNRTACIPDPEALVRRQSRGEQMRPHRAQVVLVLARRVGEPCCRPRELVADLMRLRPSRSGEWCVERLAIGEPRQMCARVAVRVVPNVNGIAGTPAGARL